MIKKEYRNILMFRWSIATASIIGLFWTIWYMVNGSVPMVTKGPISFSLLFPVSRWWDILIGPIFSVITVFLLTLDLNFDEDNPRVTPSLTAGCIMGVIVSVLTGLVYGVIIGVAFLFLCLILGVLSYYFFLLLMFIGKLLILISKWLFPEDSCIEKVEVGKHQKTPKSI